MGRSSIQAARYRAAQATAEDAASSRLASFASCTGWGLQRGRVTSPPGELLPRLSILTRGFRPGRFLSVALSLESPPPAVSRHPCSVVPGLSSCPKARGRLFTSHGAHCTLIPAPCQWARLHRMTRGFHGITAGARFSFPLSEGSRAWPGRMITALASLSRGARAAVFSKQSIRRYC